MALDLDQLTADCMSALTDGVPSQAVRELLAEVVADPVSVTATLGEPERGGIQELHLSDELTILNVIWAPKMTLMPHNHNMWAVIGVYGGDFFAMHRSEWDPEALEEHPYDVDKNLRLFEEANRLL